MTIVKFLNGTTCGAVTCLTEHVEEILSSMDACPKKMRLERIYSGLKREEEGLERAMRDCDAKAEQRALYQFARKFARFYRILGVDSQG